MSERTAVIGDVGGHLAELETALTDLGADPATGTLPEDIEVVQLGDLVHRGPDSPGVLALVARFLDASPGRWHQLVGNHEAQYLRPGGPAFDWPAQDRLDDEHADLLRHWWEEDLMKVAHHVPTDGPGTIVTHAGVTPGFAIMVHQGVATAGVSSADMTETLNDLPRAHPEDALWSPGVMLTGHPSPVAGPLWAAASEELYPAWFWSQGAGPMPWDQVHGHSSVVDFANPNVRQWRCDLVVRDKCTADPIARHVTFRQYSGRTITGVDPCHGIMPARTWAPLVLHHDTEETTP